MNLFKPRKVAPPPVFATAADLARLRGYVRAAPFGGPGVELLISEPARMSLRPETAAGFVKLNHAFRYKDLRTKRERRARIVAPDTADPRRRRDLDPVAPRRRAHRPLRRRHPALARRRRLRARGEGRRDRGAGRLRASRAQDPETS